MSNAETVYWGLAGAVALIIAAAASIFVLAYLSERKIARMDETAEPSAAPSPECQCEECHPENRVRHMSPIMSSHPGYWQTSTATEVKPMESD